MPTFKSLKEVENAILQGSQTAVEVAQEKVFNSLHKYLSFYYAEYTPVEYKRTWQLFHSLVQSGIKTSKVGAKGVFAEVYFDSSSLNYRGLSANDNWSEKAVLDTALNKGLHGGYERFKGTAVWECGKKEMGDIRGLLRMALIDAGIPIR